jgi:iron complex outermembrane receptor protein
MRASVTPGFSKPCGGSPPCAPGSTVFPWSASGGNPKLEPWRATAFDLSYEWYISRASYISVAAFYKDLKSYIFNQHSAFDFSGFPIPPDGLSDVPAGVNVSSIGQIDKPANGKGGNIRGFELSGSLELGKLVDALDGFGFQGSFSRTLSDLHPLEVADDGSNEDTVKSTRIPGLSGRVYNLTGYYEKYGFQARASFRYRSAFKGEVVQLFAVRGVTEILADKQLDAQIGYTFPDGTRLENLSILLQVNNVTDSPYRTRLGTDGGGPRTEDGAFLPETYETYGRQILFGASFRF